MRRGGRMTAERAREINGNCKWFESHGAGGSYLGAGMLYYSVPYLLEARRCVCLGSGGGFVPAMMAEAQRDLVALGRIAKVGVTLIDAGDGGTSGESPAWSTWFFEQYPEVELIKGLTDDVVGQVSDINYLHVDADHHYDHALADLMNYGARMNGRWAITAHDTMTRNPGFVQAWRAIQDYIQHTGHRCVNFPIGEGSALIMPEVGR